MIRNGERPVVVNVPASIAIRRRRKIDSRNCRVVQRSRGWNLIEPAICKVHHEQIGSIVRHCHPAKRGLADRIPGNVAVIRVPIRRIVCIGAGGVSTEDCIEIDIKRCRAACGIDLVDRSCAVRTIVCMPFHKGRDIDHVIDPVIRKAKGRAYLGRARKIRVSGGREIGKRSRKGSIFCARSRTAGAIRD